VHRGEPINEERPLLPRGRAARLMRGRFLWGTCPRRRQLIWLKKSKPDQKDHESNVFRKKKPLPAEDWADGIAKRGGGQIGERVEEPEKGKRKGWRYSGLKSVCQRNSSSGGGGGGKVIVTKRMGRPSIAEEEIPISAFLVRAKAFPSTTSNGGSSKEKKKKEGLGKGGKSNKKGTAHP